MPRHVRNFWIELQVDGRSTPIATGPKSATGGFDLTIRIRENGAISDKVLRVHGFVVDGGGKLNLLARWDGVRETSDSLEVTTSRNASMAQAVTRG